MGKAKRLKAKRREVERGFLEAMAARLTANFQREVRQSELWDELVAEFGEERAEQILRECTAEVRAGVPPDGSGDRPADLS